jgi:hypothetical protein
MKKNLLLVIALFWISQISFGKEINTNTSASNANVKSFQSGRIAFENSSISNSSVNEKNRVWLNLSNSDGAFKQSLIGYVTGATNGWDKLYDSVTIDSNPYVDFYSIDGGKNLTIQGRGLPFVTTDEVPLGYKTNIAGVFEISIDHVDGLFVGQDVFLKDLNTGVIHNLKNGAYSFTTLQGRFNNRFSLFYVDNTTTASTTPGESKITAVEAPALNVVTIDGSLYSGKEKAVFAFVNNSQITINSEEESINQIFIYSIGQKQLFEQKNINTNEYVIPNLGVANQVVIIKTQLTNGKWATSKIIL